jgi:hypothetical protein
MLEIRVGRCESPANFFHPRYVVVFIGNGRLDILIVENMIITMDAESVRNLLRERLTTADAMQQAAGSIGVSVATMYRYKSNPEGIPLGKLISLGKYLAFPIAGSVTWSRTDIVAMERRRYQLEASVAGQTGRRYVVTPSFTANCEVPEFTKALWDFDYGTGNQHSLANYLELRSKRRELYEQGLYESFELVSGAGYADFFQRQGRFKGLSEQLMRRQLDELVRSLAYPHIHRRVYLKNSPELPIFSCYSSNVAVIRVDDFTAEFGGESVARELVDIFKEYFDSADLKTVEEVRDFFLCPDGRNGRGRRNGN